MNVFEQLAELYLEIDQACSAKELQSSAEEEAPLSSMARKRELNDHAYFLFMFTRFEDHVREVSSQLIIVKVLPKTAMIWI